MSTQKTTPAEVLDGLLERQESEIEETERLLESLRESEDLEDLEDLEYIYHNTLHLGNAEELSFSPSRCADKTSNNNITVETWLDGIKEVQESMDSLNRTSG